MICRLWHCWTTPAIVGIALLIASVACTSSSSGEADRFADSALSRAAGAPTAAATLPTVGLAVMDSASTWCAEFPAAAPALSEGAGVTIVFATPMSVPAWHAVVVRRRDAECPTQFNQPRWAEYLAYDLALTDSLRRDGDDLPVATLVVASDARWVRGQDGVVRSDLDGDGTPEEARVCRADEGEHFTLWSAEAHGKRTLRAHEYFDWGALVDPTCGPEILQA